jgi:outer membrane protein OmpA-like peptidoglycan-associated protein
MTHRRLYAPVAAALALSTTWLLCPSTADAQEPYAFEGARQAAPAGAFALKIEPGLAVPLTSPQSDLFDVGGSATIKGLWSLTPYFDIGPSISFVGLPSETDGGEAGTAWSFAASARLKRPHHVPGSALAAISPWVDVDLAYVRTDDLSRPGLSLGAGVALPIGKARALWVGPFVRFFQIFSGQRAGFNDDDARILSLGISLEVTSGVERERFAPPEPAPTPIDGVGDSSVTSCPDRDGDSIPDTIDRCPDVAGPMDNWGCRKYEKIVVKPDKLELKEKLYFAWDQATLQEVSYPVLDEVVAALQENKSFRVQVEGHSSSDGPDDHNQSLSEQRAQAVLDYLVAHGVAKERLGSKGFSSSVPLDTNTTAEGRENNRRVEFVVNFNIVDDGSQ